MLRLAFFRWYAMPATLDRPRQMLGGINPRERFPEGEFTHVPQVLVFREHKTKTAKGRELVFGPSELLAVANRCNERIRNSGDYAGVTIGHNPTREEKAQGAVSPPLIGYAGPFRCMPIPGSRPERFGVFCDFWIQNEFVSELKRYPRRSAELWLEDRYEEMFLDPIACLGGEAPRLDMGLLYSRTNFRGANVEIYAAMPGAGSVFIPSDDDPKRYEGGKMIEQADVAEIIKALMETPAMKWVASKMAAEGGEAAPTDGEAAPPSAGPDPAAPPAAAAPPAVPAPGEEEKQDMAKKPYQADITKPEGMEDGTKNYEAGVAAGTVEDKPANSAPAAGSTDSEGGPKREAEHYARVNAENARLKAELAASNEKLASESAMRINAQRKARLIELHNMGYPFDVDSHAERVQYSKMDDAAFQNHCDMIVELSTPSLAGRRLYVPADAPTGIVGSAGGDKRERYSKEQVDETIRVCSKLAEAGKPHRYEDVLKKVGEGKAAELLG